MLLLEFGIYRQVNVKKHCKDIFPQFVGMFVFHHIYIYTQYNIYILVMCNNIDSIIIILQRSIIMI